MSKGDWWHMPPSFRYSGDINRAKGLAGFSRSLLPQLHNSMQFRKLQQGVLQKEYESGNVVITAEYIFGVPVITIHVSPSAARLAAKIISTIIPIQVKRTLTKWNGAINTYTPFAHGLFYTKDDCIYTVGAVPSLLSETTITSFAQVRYKSGTTIVSLMMYDFYIYAAEADPYTAINVVGEVGSANLRLVFPRELGMKCCAALSEDLQTLYVAYSIDEGGGNNTITYSVYVLDNGQWVLNSSGIADGGATYLRDGLSVDRQGRLGGWTSNARTNTAVPYSVTQSYTDSTGAPQYDCTVPSVCYGWDVDETLAYTHGLYTFYLYDISTGSFVSHANVHYGVTVANGDYTTLNTSGQEYYDNYSHGHTWGNSVVTGATATHDYIGTRTGYSTSEARDGYFIYYTIDGVSAFAESNVDSGGVYGGLGGGDSFKTVTNTYFGGWEYSGSNNSSAICSMNGAITVTTTRVSALVHHDYLTNEANYSASGSGVGLAAYGPPWCNTNGICVRITGTSARDYLYLAWPVHVNPITSFSHAFISHDQETGTTLFGAKYSTDATPAAWRLYCGEPLSGTAIDITDHIADICELQSLDDVEAILFYNYEDKQAVQG